MPGTVPSTWLVLTCVNSPKCLVSDLCGPMDCSPPGSSVHGISQTGILEWVAMLSLGDFPHPGIKPRSPTFQADSWLTKHYPPCCSSNSLLPQDLCTCHSLCLKPALPPGTHPHGSHCPGLYSKSPPWRGLPWLHALGQCTPFLPSPITLVIFLHGTYPTWHIVLLTFF